MFEKPQKQHEWLQQWVGEWTSETDIPETPEHPAGKVVWTERVRMLEGLWLVAEATGLFPGTDQPATTIQTIGFNPRTERYVGTWIGSMMTHLWVYDGWIDESGKQIVLEAEGPRFDAEGKPASGTAMYRDSYELAGPDLRILRSTMRDDEGQWQEFMSAQYQRVK